MSVDRPTCDETKGNPKPASDLLDRFTTYRDEAAFGELVQRHSGLVMGVCRRVLRCRHDSEDAFQATFLVLARAARRIRRRESVAARLHGTAYRVASRMRDKRVRRREAPLPESIAVNGDVLAELAQRYEWEAFDEELNRLPAKYRDPLVLHYLLEKTARETAAELGLTVRAVEGRLRRGKSELRYRLVRRGVSLAVVGVVVVKVNTAAGTVAATLVDETIETGLTYVSGGAISNAAAIAAEELSTMSTVGVPTSIVVAAAVILLLFGGVQPRNVPKSTANELFNLGYADRPSTSGLTDQRSTFTLVDATDASSQTPESADPTDADGSQPAADEAEPAQNALPGRIYLDVHLGVPRVDGMDHVWGVIGVDPNTGKWEVVSGENIGSLRVLPDGKFGLISLHDRVLNQSRLRLLDVQTKASRDLGPFSSAIPSRNGKMAIVTQTAFPEANRAGLVLATGHKFWRLNLDTPEKEPLAIPNDHMLLDASGDLEWCLTLRMMVKPDEPQRIIQRIVVIKTDGTEERPLLPDDGASHGFACFAPNGEQIALISRSPDQGSSIQMVDFNGQNARMLYQPKEMDQSPASLCWSPDGEKLLAIIGEYAENERSYRLLIIDADSAAQRELTLKDARSLSLRYANWQ